MTPKIFKFILVTFLAILTFSFISHKIPVLKWQKTQILKSDLAPEEKILENLTLEQKVGQLFLIGFEGKILTSQLENLIKTIHPGGVLLLQRNIENKEQLTKLIKELQKISFEDNGLPLFIVVDQEGEPMSRIKFLNEKTPQSEIKNVEQAFEVGFSRGQELKNLGINLNLAPVLDIIEPGDFLYSRSFQKNPEETGKLAKALISGQKQARIFTAIKHFPGYSGIAFNPERVKLPILSKIPEIAQFIKALESQPEMVMTSNVVYTEIDNNFPFTLSPKGIQFFKNELKNDFLIISDDLSSPVLKKEFSLKNTVILAFQAGVDILIVAGFDEPEDPSQAFNFLLEAAKNGEISEKRIEQSVLKIIRLKENLLE